jgi:uridine kinase
MKIISIAAVTAGGKTTIVNELKKQIPSTKSLHFDEYSFEGEVDDFYTWTKHGADYNVWNLHPLIKDILEIKKNSDCEYLLLDYPFAYCHKALSQYIDCAIFIDTPLDIAMARRILRDMGNATGDEIRQNMELYLKYARIAYIQMIKDVLPSSDYIIDGTKELSEKTDEIKKIMLSL